MLFIWKEKVCLYFCIMNKILEDIRTAVPALSQQVYGKPLVYLDNAATSQKPVQVIELVNMMNSGLNGNVHRAMHYLSEQATMLYEQARERVRKYINAPERENIIFTSGATAAINLVASSFCYRFLKYGDSVVIAGDSHHSNIVPWQIACERAGARLKVVPVDENGRLEIERVDSLVDSRTRLVAVTHISNVLGIVNDIGQITEMAHARGAKVLVDGAQGIVHAKVDVQAMDCDFYAFSGHKVYGETGSGVLYGKSDLLNQMPPYMGGGEMVETVTYEKTTYAPLPLKFEAGTPNFIAAASLAPAIDFADALASGEWGRAVKEEEAAILAYLPDALREIEGLTLYGTSGKKIPLFSFSVDGCNSSDIAQMLDKLGVAVRSGQMCSEPLMNRYGVTGMVRASFAPYNTLEEAVYLADSLKRVVKMLR